MTQNLCRDRFSEITLPALPLEQPVISPSLESERG